jgi:multiple sugar transport system substrate-binding protein
MRFALVNYHFVPRKIYPILVLVFALVIITASCGGDEIEPTPVPSVPTRTPRPSQTVQASITPTRAPTLVPVPTLPVDESALRGTTVEFWHLHSFLLPSVDGTDTLQTLVDEFNRTNNWGLRIQTRSFNDYAEIFNTIQSSVYGDLPNLALGYNYQAISVYRSSDLLVDLTPYLQDPRWGLAQEDIEDFFPLFWQQEQDGGALLGLPFYRSGQVLFYNQSWAEGLGFNTPPTSPDEFKEQACAAAAALSSEEDGREGTGGWVIDSSAPSLLGWIYAFGGDLELPEGGGYSFDSPAVSQAFTFLRELYEDGCAWLSESALPSQEFAARQGLFISSSVTGLHGQHGAFDRAGSSDRWTVIPFPSQDNQPAIVTYGPTLVVLAGEPEQELAAWLFARWLTSPEIQARWVQNQGTLPTRTSVLDLLVEYRENHPQWDVAAELLQFARVEPGRPSWRLVHFILSDAGRYLFSPLVTIRELPEIIETLDQAAAELDGQFR